MNPTAKDLIQELASQPYKFRWDARHYASFSDKKGIEYTVNFSPDGDHYELSFFPSRTHSFGRTKAGDSFKVLSTVFKILSNFLHKEKDSFVFFRGADRAQHQLYVRAMDKYADKFGLAYDFRGDELRVTKSE